MQKFSRKANAFASHSPGARGGASVLEIAKNASQDICAVVKATFHCLVLMKTLIFKRTNL
jgi:hypothetical protein